MVVLVAIQAVNLLFFLKLFSDVVLSASQWETLIN